VESGIFVEGAKVVPNS